MKTECSHSGGSLNNILLNKRVVQPLGTEVTFLNTYVEPQITHTQSESQNYTRIVVAWEKDSYPLTKEVKVGQSYLGVIKLGATVVLAGERLVAFAKRYGL